MKVYKTHYYKKGDKFIRTLFNDTMILETNDLYGLPSALAVDNILITNKEFDKPKKELLFYDIDWDNFWGDGGGLHRYHDQFKLYNVLQGHYSFEYVPKLQTIDNEIKTFLNVNSSDPQIISLVFQLTHKQFDSGTIWMVEKKNVNIKEYVHNITSDIKNYQEVIESTEGRNADNGN